MKKAISRRLRPCTLNSTGCNPASFANRQSVFTRGSLATLRSSLGFCLAHSQPSLVFHPSTQLLARAGMLLLSPWVTPASSWAVPGPPSRHPSQKTPHWASQAHNWGWFLRSTGSTNHSSFTGSHHIPAPAQGKCLPCASHWWIYMKEHNLCFVFVLSSTDKTCYGLYS